MGIVPVQAVGTVLPQNGTTTSNSAGSSGATPGFGQFLSDALGSANQLTNSADTAAAQYAAGGPVSLDQLMIAEQKASLAVDLVVQVRNRAVSAYQTIMNMQV